MLLALDLGSTTGFAIGEPGVIVSGAVKYKHNRFTGGGARYLEFQTWLTDLYGRRKFAHVVLEEVRAHKGVDAAHAYGGFLAVLTAFCERHHLPYSSIPVGTIKHFATGNGSAPKTKLDRLKKGRAGLSVEEAVRSWGFNPQDDNEADAIALWHCWAARHPAFFEPAEKISAAIDLFT